MRRWLLGISLVLLLAGGPGTADAGERPKITVLAVGYAGAGKGTAGRLLVDRLRSGGVSASHFSGGDHIRAKAVALAKDPSNPAHVNAAFGHVLAEVKGRSQIGLAREALGHDLPDVVVIDGPRSPRDVDTLRRDVPSMLVVAIEAPPGVRGGATEALPRGRGRSPRVDRLDPSSLNSA